MENTSKFALLTIDDGPSSARPEILKHLEKRNIKAIFFSEGKKIRKNQDASRDTIRHGHVLGNHGYSHQYFSKLPVKECIHEIEKTDVLVRQIYHSLGIFEYPKFFRFPFGDRGDLCFGKLHPEISPLGQSRSQIIQDSLIDLGYTGPILAGLNPGYRQTFGTYRDWSWTFDTMDWSIPGIFSSKALMKIKERFKSSAPKDFRGISVQPSWMSNNESTEIILMHDQPKLKKHFATMLDLLVDLGVVFMPPLENPA